MQDSKLKAALFLHWGYDLSIVADFGSGTRNNPIIILPDRNMGAKETAFWTINGLHKGRGAAIQAKSKGSAPTGVFWRSLDGGLENPDENGIAKYRLERVVLSDEKKETEIVSFYFDVSKVERTARNDPKDRPGPRLRYFNQEFPAEIGWLKYDLQQSVDYAKQHDKPELGYGLAYGAPGVKATIYIYPAPKSASEKLVLREEFVRAAGDVEAIMPEAQAWSDRPTNDNLLRRFWRVDRDGNNVAALGLALHHGLIFKVRMTWYRDPFIESASAEFFKEVLRVGGGMTMRD